MQQRKFESFCKLILEASPPPAPDDEEEIGGEEDIEDIDFDEPGDDMEDMGDAGLDQDLGVEGEEGMESPADAVGAVANTPQEFELAKLAILALQSGNENINPMIYDDFEKKRNSEQVLNYIQAKVGSKGQIDKSIDSIIGELEGEFNPNQVVGKSVSDKLAYYNQNGEPMPDTTLDYWTRIILNALKYDGNDYDIGGPITAENVNGILDKLKADFNYDTRGMFDKMIKDRSTGSNMSGPGVF